MNFKYTSDHPKPGLPLAVVTGLTAILLPLKPENEKVGEVLMNGIAVGGLYTPSLTSSLVLASEVGVRLPVWAMNVYAKAILDEFQPSSVFILDTYAAPAYIADSLNALPQSAPIRYLRTTAAKSTSKTTLDPARPFAPPNLLQSTTAAFLSILNFGYPQTPGTAILLPAQHMPHPTPKDLTVSSLNYPSYDHLDEQGWDMELLVRAVQMILGESVPADVLLGSMSPKQRVALQGKRARGTEVGEGGMYI